MRKAIKYSSSDRAGVPAWLIAAVPALAGGALIAAFALNRRFLAYGVETDFLWRFVPEAERFLRGQPLLLDTHPPLYSLAIAALHRLGAGWEKGAFLLSFASAVALLAASWSLWKKSLGAWTAWGGFLALAASPVFLELSASASSDMFFAALYWSAALALWNAGESGSRRAWIASGLMIGAAFLSRANALTLAVLLALPWAEPGRDAPAKRRGLLFLLGAFLIPLIAWAAYAAYSRSPLLPSRLPDLVAQTYFTPGADRISGDGLSPVAGRYSSVASVVASQPRRVAAIYAVDLLYALAELPLLAAFPFNLLILPGLAFLVAAVRRSSRPRFWTLFFCSAALQIALLNVKAYEPRFYLFLVPVLGAGAGLCAERARRALPAFLGKDWVLLALPGLLAVLLAGAGFRGSARLAWSSLHAQDEELGEAVAALRSAVPPGAAVVARKPHVPFYLGRRSELFPAADSMERLRETLLPLSASGPLYLYYGDAEASSRPALAGLRDREATPPPWLRRVAAGGAAGGWALYEFVPSR
ncbi:MAG: glycosyltransferase family 39 protein [Elusimicrobia bacterium]|nr:glycosyltransferase family 39 protein [Elusimicrobiota bacterium]